MDFVNYNEFASLQNRFWLQILGDHSRFILNAAPSYEPEIVDEANYFKELFDTLLDRSRSSLTYEELTNLNMQSLDAAYKIRTFKLNILKSMLTRKIKLNISETFLNHMLNEVDEYLLILNTILKNQKYAKHPIHYHLIWLSDASAHASILTGVLDLAEKQLINTSRGYEQDFSNLYLKAVELNGYLRTGLMKFPVLDKFNYDVDTKMTLFQQFLKELRELNLSKEVLGTLTPLIPDHMLREECYYLSMLSVVSSLTAKDCNPAEARIE